jgi:hypothetical protein
LTFFALLACLVVPATAAAHHGPTTFERAFPGESRLCAAVAGDHVPAPLQGSEAQVTEACTALHSAFDAALAGMTGAPNADALKAAMADALAGVQSACGPDATDPQACDDALHEAHDALKNAKRGTRHGKRAFKRAIRQARHDFRDAIRPLLQSGDGERHGHGFGHGHGHGHGDDPAGDDAPTGDGDAPKGDDPPAGDDAPTGDGPSTDVPTDD